MIVHVVNTLKEMRQHIITLKIPFYLIDITRWQIESWYSKNNELVITLAKKDTALATAPATAQRLE